ncbi:uncharacterized protein LOC143154275 [Ptiloglossa arizonensis]|uniref:uncharacterized protein LOC143154275 n=1 Tax=Ptiloglossa arizonensis TaxID=3350558 RepID=UPI003FA14837
MTRCIRRSLFILSIRNQREQCPSIETSGIMKRLFLCVGVVALLVLSVAGISLGHNDADPPRNPPKDVDRAKRSPQEYPDCPPPPTGGPPPNGPPPNGVPCGPPPAVAELSSTASASMTTSGSRMRRFVQNSLAGSDDDKRHGRDDTNPRDMETMAMPPLGTGQVQKMG